MQGEAVAGFTNWRRAIRSQNNHVTQTVFKADVQLRARNLNRRDMSFEEMRQASEHEFGHILGLDDSDVQGDLMAPLIEGHPVGQPRDYEIDAVKLLRAEARQVRDEALARQKDTQSEPST